MNSNNGYKKKMKSKYVLKLSCLCTQYCFLPAIKLYTDKKYYTRSTTMSYNWRVKERKLKFVCTEIFLFHGTQLHPSTNDKW